MNNVRYKPFHWVYGAEDRFYVGAMLKLFRYCVGEVAFHVCPANQTIYLIIAVTDLV